MSKRIEAHKIDTRAFRIMSAQLDDDWLIRNQEDRDYGIDVTIERYDNKNPTGDYIFIQLKGTKRKFGKKVSLSGFPVKTIKYSLLFNIPFFLFHSSNTSNETKFVWLQKYVDTKLKETTPDWQDQDTVTIYFPEENDLATNQKKIIEIIDKDKSKKRGVEYLSLFESLKIHTGSVIIGKQYGVGEYCSNVCSLLYEMKSFIKRYSSSFNHEWKVIEILNMADAFKEISEHLTADEDNIILINNCIDHLELIKFSFLDDDEYDIFAVKMMADEPY